MGSKTKVTQLPNQQTNTYSQITPENTADTQALRDFQFKSDPGIPYQYAGAKRDLTNSFSNPLGANTTQAIRDATLRSGIQNLDQQQGQAESESYNNLQGMNYGKLSALQQATAPRIVQSGSSGFNSQATTTPGLANSLIQGAATVGAGALT